MDLASTHNHQKFSYHGKVYFVTILFTIFLNCGNPALKKTFTLYEKQPEIDGIIAETVLTKPYFLKIQKLTDEELDEYAYELNIASDERYYRVAPLTYFQFELKNDSKQPIVFRLFESFFFDQKGKRYYTISQKAFKERFTSIAYKRFQYEPLHSFYLTNNGSQTKNKGNAFSKFSPSEDVILKPGEAGVQVVVFERLADNHDYTWNFELPSGMPKTAKFNYRLERGDLDR